MKALMPMLIDAMERHGHLDLDPIIKEKVLTISAATIDRLLPGVRGQIDGQRKRRKSIGAMDKIVDWLTFHNHRRVRSSLGYLSPMQFERAWLAAQNKQATQRSRLGGPEIASKVSTCVR